MSLKLVVVKDKINYSKHFKLLLVLLNTFNKSEISINYIDLGKRKSNSISFFPFALCLNVKIQ